jgi:hypothetical protein
VRVCFEEVEGWLSLRYRKRAVLPMREVCGRTGKREREREREVMLSMVQEEGKKPGKEGEALAC